jgi:hypothetical protein
MFVAEITVSDYHSETGNMNRDGPSEHCSRRKTGYRSSWTHSDISGDDGLAGISHR